MKRTAPLLITAIAGLVLVVSFFIPAFQRAGEEAAIWFDILAAIAFVLGGANLFRLQLQSISDRAPGWGYAAVTLIFFVVTLALGLLKVNCPPESSVQAYGQISVPLPLAALPRFQIPLSVPLVRADGEPLPKSVQQQLSVEPGDAGPVLVFAGWMQNSQQDDLANWQDTLEWKCQIERLAEQAQPPGSLQGRVSYDVGHQLLLFKGVLRPELRQALQAVLKPDPRTTQALDQLQQLTHRESSQRMSAVPTRFAIPQTEQDVIRLTGDEFKLIGPMSIPLRENLAQTWRHDPRVRPQTAAQVDELRQKLEDLGSPLNERQRTAFENLFAAVWNAELLVAVLNTAGIGQPVPKSACELLAEIQSGNLNPDPVVPPPATVVLNAAQVALIEKFVTTPEFSPEELASQLPAAGELTADQQAALAGFFEELPTRGEQWRDLCFRLLSVGPLTTAQRDFLLTDFREQFRWRQQVGNLFLAAHQQRFLWSGDYSAQGSPFWWLYEYMLQPLLTTTFAVLAFYVASAAFRAFRAKNLEAILLLGTAFIILLGRTSAGPALTNWIPEQFSAFKLDHLTVYIMSIFNTAGNRAIMIGIALGTVSTSLKVLLGIDRSYLGSDR